MHRGSSQIQLKPSYTGARHTPGRSRQGRETTMSSSKLNLVSSLTYMTAENLGSNSLSVKNSRTKALYPKSLPNLKKLEELGDELTEMAKKFDFSVFS